MSKIKHLIFDLGEVIVFREKKPNFEEIDLKLALQEGTIRSVIRDVVMKRNLDRDFDQDEYVRATYKDPVTPELVNEIFKETVKNERLNQELVGWVQKQKGKYQISLLSNTRVTLERLHEKFGIDHLFDHIFISSDLHLAKPDPEIFQHVLKVLAAAPEECLFVDDSLGNIESAKNLGFNVILFEYDNEKFFEAAKVLNIL